MFRERVIRLIPSEFRKTTHFNNPTIKPFLAKLCFRRIHTKRDNTFIVCNYTYYTVDINEHFFKQSIL